MLSGDLAKAPHPGADILAVLRNYLIKKPMGRTARPGTGVQPGPRAGKRTWTGEKMGKPKKSVDRVRQALKEGGFDCQVKELPGSTKTAVQAAQAVDCDLGQIVKSLVFKGKETGKPYMAEVSGKNRANEKLLCQAAGEPVKMPDADFVRKVTGYAIGGIPPLGHDESIATFIDEDLMQYGELWAAAGTPFSMFRLTPEQLKAMTGGKVIKLA